MDQWVTPLILITGIWMKVKVNVNMMRVRGEEAEAKQVKIHMPGDQEGPETISYLLLFLRNISKMKN